MNREIRGMLILFVGVPLLIGAMYHIGNYLITGRMPSFVWDDGREHSCGAGPLKWDC